MGVRDEDVRDRAPGGGAHDGLEMRIILRAGIDQGQLLGSDEISVRSVERERARVVGNQPHDAWGELAWLPIGEFHRLLECDLGGHADFDVSRAVPYHGRRRRDRGCPNGIEVP